MIKHIIDESKILMQATKYEDSLYFYHDTLTLMTDKECKTLIR